MSKLLLTSDLHLGHKNIHKYRTEFSSAEEHHEIIFDNLATSVNSRDSLILLGDIAFTSEWLTRIGTIKCAKKTLILGNHDTEYTHISEIVAVYDQIHSLWSKRNFWFSHAPLHPQELRGRKANIHGHLHGNMVWVNKDAPKHNSLDEIDTRYINVCVEHTDWKPITFKEATFGY